MTAVLFVCTGNICRSPMAAGFAGSVLESRCPGLSVRSAGMLVSGFPPTREVIEVMARRGLDVAGHRSRRLASALAENPDLVVGMAREHVREVAGQAPWLASRTFTLKELVRLGDEVGPRRAGEPLGRYLERVGSIRAELPVTGDRSGRLADLFHDVADPIGQGIDVYEGCAKEIEDLVTHLADLLWPQD
jgi:protein-tyrosine-phosphatase